MNSKPLYPKRDPVTRTSPPPNGIAWQWGFDAARDGCDHCPWDEGTPMHADWQRGHAEGLSEVAS